MTHGGYSKAVVLDWLAEHGTAREDGRYVAINKGKLAETFRDTIDRWRRSDDPLVPLGRWDELLLANDVMLWEFELWAERKHGTDGYQLIEE